eukprot:1125148-Ditylum_brightwellii.AAC.1
MQLVAVLPALVSTVAADGQNLQLRLILHPLSALILLCHQVYIEAQQHKSTMRLNNNAFFPIFKN